MLKLVIQQTLVPGDSLVEKFQRAAEYGFDAVFELIRNSPDKGSRSRFGSSTAR